MEGADTQQSIQVKGGGYLAALGVYHELHCLVTHVLDWTHTMKVTI